jgi:hypothetical protein
MNALIPVALIVLSLSTGVGHVKADPQNYQAPAHNYYQNNWMNA